MRVLTITSEWPTHQFPTAGIFVSDQVRCIRARGILVDVFYFRGEKNPVKYLRSWLKLRRSLDLDQYDIIHAHFGQSALLAIPSLIPLIITFHGSDIQGFVGQSGRQTWASRILRVLSCYAALRADAVILVSKYLARYLPLGIAYSVIPCGISMKLFQQIPQASARERLGLALNKRLVLFVGDPSNPIKRHDLAKASVALACRGLGGLDVELISVSRVPHTTVPLYMSACDVLLISSKHEGSPTVIKEALSCNLPIVAVDVGDVADHITKVSGCILCADDKPTTLANALIQVLRYPVRLHVRDNIAYVNENLAAERVIEVYRSVAKDRGFTANKPD